VAFSPDGGRLAAAAVAGPSLFRLGQIAGEMHVWDGRPAEKE
jgi:hypothetical protein